jgi:HD-like signal output (HDOD) protein
VFAATAKTKAVAGVEAVAGGLAMGDTRSFIEIVDNLITSSRARLPVFNTTVARIQQEIAKDEPDLRRIENLIVSDQALTAEVLRYSNSSFYKGLNQVTTVRNAVVRLGVNEVSNIVMTVTHESQFRSKDPFLHSVMNKLWRHALGTAVAAHWLCRHCGLHGIAHEAFFAGLLHDVGKLFILMVIDDLLKSGRLPANPSIALLMEAMDHLHTGHGYTLMKHWNLPEKYAEVARNHHAEALDAENYLSLSVRMADKACNKMGLGLHQDPAVVLLATPEANELHLTDVDLAKLEIMIEDTQALKV